MKKYFSSGFFLNLKSIFSAIQRSQPELLGVSEQETTRETMRRSPRFRGLCCMKGRKRSYWWYVDYTNYQI